MRSRQQLFSGIAIVFVLLSVVAFPRPAYAAAPVITSVNPSLVINSVDSDVTITGTGFTIATSVLLGTTPLLIKSWSETSLVVVVPGNIAPNTYALVVSNGPGDTDKATFTPFTVAAAAPPSTFGRPQITMRSFRTNVGEITYGTDFNLVVRLHNAGQVRAYNVQATFTSTDLIPTKTGGVTFVGDIESGNTADANQQMTAAGPLYGKTSVAVDVAVSYYDEKGTSYSEKFSLTVPVKASNYVYSTPTPTAVNRSQLVITGYQTDLSPLEPGSQFELGITVQNMGNANAKSVTMIVGGGSASSGGSGGTPQPGGVSGGSGEFTNFAPVGTSNVQSLGDLASGATLSASQKLIVNVSTNPGAYPMKITFSYTDEKGNIINDEQVITFRIYSLPKVDVSFYQPVTSLFTGQPNLLPLQIVNLGKRNSVLSNIKIQTDNGTLENSLGLIGSLDPGAFYTIDSTLFPDTPGIATLTISIDYTDDFNQPRTITKTLELEVLEMPVEPTFDPNLPPGEGGGGGGEFIPAAEETFLQKAWRFILGLFGLDSGAPSSAPSIEGGPTEMPVPIQPGGGGGKG